MPKPIEQRLNSPHLIETVLKDGTQCLLPSQVLDVMLAQDRVSQFRRSSGWVAVGIVPIRARRSEFVNGMYQGPERRSSAFH